jgi:hypothetical protein
MKDLDRVSGRAYAPPLPLDNVAAPCSSLHWIVVAGHGISQYAVALA